MVESRAREEWGEWNSTSSLRCLEDWTTRHRTWFELYPSYPSKYFIGYPRYSYRVEPCQSSELWSGDSDTDVERDADADLDVAVEEGESV